MANPHPDTSHLIPFKPGESGNPAGRPKGRRDLSTIIRETMEEELDWRTIPVAQAKTLAEKYAGKAGWQVVLAVMASRSLTGDVKAAKWMSDNAYSKAIDITSKGEKIQSVSVVDLGQVKEPEQNDEPNEEDIIEGEPSEAENGDN